jgi:type II pantothenate kinase
MSTPCVTSALGIDAGASICKIAAWRRSELITEAVPAGNAPAALECVSRLRPARVVATGGGAQRLIAALAERHPDQPMPIAVGEFEAWGRGAPIVARREGVSLAPRYLLVSLGTGTSVLRIDGSDVERVGGTALGGGALLGLAELLLGVKTFAALADLAKRGDRRKVDLLVEDIYAGAVPPLAGKLNAASFAKRASRRPEDLAHALIGLVGENVGLICGHLSLLHDAAYIVYCGSTLSENPALRQVLSDVADRMGRRATFLTRGAFCGAVGAATWAGGPDA